jgi:ADP-ribosyl-[dinitrogen reductase] hydrolase
MTRAGLDILLPGDLRERFASEVEPRAALGALLGLAVGDAVGTTLEFTELDAPAFPALATGPLVDLVGGGPFGLQAGEVTDDTQMATALADQIRVSKREISAEYLAARYIEWSKFAFDIGIQTRKALAHADAGLDALAAGRRVWDEATGLKPAGNGSLMRTAPIGVFLAALPDERRQLSLSDSAVTHFDPRCQLACVAYNAAIAHAVGRGASARGAHRAARAELEPALAALVARHPDLADEARAAVADLTADLEAAEQDDPDLYGPELHMHRTAGFVRVAFRLAFWHLLHAPDYRSAVLDAANRGGDADTNAAITGALVGAVHRVEGIPPAWIAAVLGAPGLVGDRAEYHPRVFLHALHTLSGAPAHPPRARPFAPYVARAFPAEHVTAERWMFEGELTGQTWPIGPGVELVAWRRGGAEGGVARGRLASGEPVVVTVRSAQPGDGEVAARLGFELPGVAPLVAAGSFQQDGRELFALVEREPAGEPLSMPGFPMISALALERFRQLLEIAARAAEAGVVLEGIRPELVHHAAGGVSGLAPRGPAFLRARVGAASPFHALYEAPEIARGAQPGPAADVFSACAVLAFLLKRRSPFEKQPSDDHPIQLAAMQAGPPPLPLPLDDSLLDGLRAGLDPDPARRPSARELLAVW